MYQHGKVSPAVGEVCQSSRQEATVSLLISIKHIIKYGFVLDFTFFHTYLCKYIQWDRNLQVIFNLRATQVVCAETSGEKVPEVFEGKVDMTFDRTDGNVEGLGYFLGRHSPVTGHHEYPLTLGRHRADNPVKPAGSLQNRHTFLNVSGIILAFRGGRNTGLQPSCISGLASHRFHCGH